MIISLSGRKSSGKTTLANICVNKGYILLNFGDALKTLICKMMNISYDYLNKNKEAKINIKLLDYLNFIKTEIDIPEDRLYLLDKQINSYRELLQYLGTDIIRKIDPDWHIRKLDTYIIENGLKEKNIVFADTRFINEFIFIKNLGGICWYILSPNNFFNISNHISETELSWEKFDNVLVNKGDDNIIINWEKYLFDFDKSNLTINYKRPTFGVPIINENLKSNIIIYDGIMYLKVNELTNIFVENLDFTQDNNYYKTENPYIIESVKRFF